MTFADELHHATGGGFGIWLDNDLEYGVSQTCATYGA